MRIEPLRRRHRPLLAGFRNQHASLVEYLRRYAMRHAEKDLLARTYLAIDDCLEPPRVAGCFSLSAVSVDRQSVPPGSALDGLPRYPIPGVLLARMAVDARVQGQGLGRYLFEEALALVLELGRSGPIGFRLLVTDAIDGDAARFYEHLGLARLGDLYPCRLILDLHPILGATLQGRSR